jgi:multisubunit Na+/H+ antiporter MnhG subunit
VCVIRGFDGGAAKAQEPRAVASFQLPAGRFSLDRDHLDEALRVAASVWLMFLAIVYIPDVPAGLGALGIATRLALADTAMPTFSLTHLLGPVVAAMAGAFPFYILLMPQLSSFPELALAVSVVVFAIVYIFHEPRQALLRTIFAYLFFTLISVTNEQTYNFMHYATTATMWLVILSILAVTEYFPVSHQPDRVFLRLLNRFFRSCEFLLRLGRARKQEYSLMQRWKARFHAYEVVTLPAKLAQWGRSLQPGALGASSTPGQVQTVVNRLWGLSYRMQALLQARAVHQSTALVRELRPDIRAWRKSVESILRSLAVAPELADHEDLQARLRATLSRLEARIEETLDCSNGQSLSAEESENMYRLLSAHRGVSESLVQLTKQAAAVDWERLREARF